MLKTGVISENYFEIDDYRQGLEEIKKDGYDCVDYQGASRPNCPLYALSNRQYDEYFDDLSKSAQENGLEVFQMHGLWPTVDDTTRAGIEKNVEYFLKQIRAAEIMRCNRLVLHPCLPHGWGEELRKEDAFDYTRETIEKLLPTAKKSNVILCVENMPFAHKGHSFSEIGELKRLINSFNDPNVKACFDTGHSHVTGENVYECIKTLGQDIAALHVHDTKYGKDIHMIPFTGQIDWLGFIRGLKEVGYQGCISLEAILSRSVPKQVREKTRIALSETAKWLAEQCQ